VALRGTLGDFSLADILQLIGLQRKTGLLVLQRGEERVQVVFENGRVVAAETSLRAPRGGSASTCCAPASSPSRASRPR